MALRGFSDVGSFFITTIKQSAFEETFFHYPCFKENKQRLGLDHNVACGGIGLLMCGPECYIISLSQNIMCRVCVPRCHISKMLQPRQFQIQLVIGNLFQLVTASQVYCSDQVANFSRQSKHK